jgi:hypothetical protein
VTDAEGFRRRLRRGGFPSEEAAIAARDTAAAEPSPRVLAQAWTVKRWLVDWLEKVDVRPSTLRGYTTIVHCHLIPATFVQAKPSRQRAWTKFDGMARGGQRHLTLVTGV